MESFNTHYLRKNLNQEEKNMFYVLSSWHKHLLFTLMKNTDPAAPPVKEEFQHRRTRRVCSLHLLLFVSFQNISLIYVCRICSLWTFNTSVERADRQPERAKSSVRSSFSSSRWQAQPLHSLWGSQNEITWSQLNFIVCACTVTIYCYHSHPVYRTAGTQDNSCSLLTCAFISEVL